MKPSVIVWDLETVPDIGGFAAANDLVGKSASQRNLADFMKARLTRARGDTKPFSPLGT